MSKKTISLEQVEARLGRLQQPRAPSYDDDGFEALPPPAPRASAEDDDDDGAVIFYSSLVVGFIAIVMGVLWLGGVSLKNPFGSGGRSDFVSAVAAACDKGWRDGRDNRDQMDCWLKHDVSRLCQADERRALVQRLGDYTTQAELSHAKELGSVMAMAGNVGGAMRVGLEDAMSRHSSSEAESQAHMDAAASAAQDYMAPAMAAMEANRNNVSEHQLQQDLRGLIKQGYITKGDFGWSAPAWVSDTFAAEPGLDKPRCNG